MYGLTHDVAFRRKKTHFCMAMVFRTKTMWEKL